MTSLVRFATTIALLMTFLSPAGRSQWLRTRGPEGGPVNCFGVHGTTVFAGTNGGVCASSNGGALWFERNSGLTNSNVRAFLVVADTLLGATQSRLFRSTNDGISWSGVSSGLMFVTVWALARQGTAIYAGTAGGGVFVSADNAASWKSAGPTSSLVTSFAVIDSVLFAGTYTGLFASTNGGSSWFSSKAGLTDTVVYALIARGRNCTLAPQLTACSGPQIAVGAGSQPATV